jgi:hypothetical protein
MWLRSNKADMVKYIIDTGFKVHTYVFSLAWGRICDMNTRGTAQVMV